MQFLLYGLGGDFIGKRQNKYNRSRYDQVLIRFPLGTKKRFKTLVPGVSFNGYVVDLLTSRLMMLEQDFSYDEFVNYPPNPFEETLTKEDLL